MCQSKGLSMSILRRGCQDDKPDIWDWECSCDWGMAGDAWVTNTFRGGEELEALLEPHVTSDGPRGRHENGLERQWDLAPAGRVTQALWLLPWLRSARTCRLGRQARATVTVCLDQLSGKEDSLTTPMWTSQGSGAWSSGGYWPWNLQRPWLILFTGEDDMLVYQRFLEISLSKTRLIQFKDNSHA